MDWNGSSSRQAYLVSNGYMGTIQYLGRREDSTPKETESETKISWSRIQVKLESLEEKGLVEETEESFRKKHSTYSLTSEGREALKFYQEGPPEREKEVKKLSPAKRIDKRTYMMEGGYIVEGVEELDSEVWVEVTDREAIPGVNYVEIIEKE